MLANLYEKDFSSEYWVAKKGNTIIGVCAYFPVFSSFSLFTQTKGVPTLFVDEVAKQYTIKHLLGMASCAEEAYNKLLERGYHSKANPKNAFFQLDMKDFHFFPLKEGTIRRIEEKDIDQVVLLHRHLHQETLDKPIEPSERKKIRLSKYVYVLEVGGKIVSTVLSNGMAKKAFQILGVVTHPDYRKKGYAKALISYMIQFFQEKFHAQTCVLFTSFDNIIACAIFSSPYKFPYRVTHPLFNIICY